MIVKAIIAKKVAVVAVMALWGYADGRLENRRIRLGGREANPIVRTIARPLGIYGATESWAVVAGAIYWKKPHSKAAKAAVASNFIWQGVGIVSNLRVHPEITGRR